MAESTSERQIAKAVRTVELLDQQAESLRAELMKLRNSLQETHKALSDSREGQMLEANEHLVLAALHADAIAELAITNLDNLARSSQRDALTDTPKRALMLDRIEKAIALARRHRSCIAVLFIDLDLFKQINDTLGHAVGDEVLCLAARALESVVREADTVGRHAGDEFVVLLPEIAQAPDAAFVASKMLSALAKPKTVDGHELSLLASIGIAIYPGDGDDAATLINRADAAMYRAKRQGRGRFEFYTQESDRSPAVDAELADARPMESLREINERLLISALAAQGLEAGARAAHHQRTQFMATVAHELRNPLVPIRIAAGMLHDARTDPAQVDELHKIIDQQVTHMSRLVNDLLDGSRIGSGTLRLNRSIVELGSLLGLVADACRLTMDTRRQELEIRLPPDSVIVQGDSIRLVQVFSNLLDNASHYTPKGGKIMLEVRQIDRAVVITVSDSGIGIAAEALEHVFDLFLQGTSALPHDNHRGLGIGLAVARDLVEAHDGTIVASSAGVGQGSQFTVTLPTVEPSLH